MKTAEEWYINCPTFIDKAGDEQDYFPASYIQQIQLDALKEGMRRAANTTVDAYPRDVQRQKLETAFDKGLNEHRKVILTTAEQLTIKDL